MKRRKRRTTDSSVSRNRRIAQKASKHRPVKRRLEKKHHGGKIAMVAESLGVSKRTLVAYVRYKQGIGDDCKAPIRLTRTLINELQADREELLVWETGEISKDQQRFFPEKLTWRRRKSSLGSRSTKKASRRPQGEPSRWIKRRRRVKKGVRLIYTPVGGQPRRR